MGCHKEKNKSSVSEMQSCRTCSRGLILTSRCVCLDPPEKPAHCSSKLSWTVAGEPSPLWILFFFFFFFSQSAIFRSVWERHGHCSSACRCSINCSCYPEWKTLVIFCALKLITQEQKKKQKNKPTEWFGKKKKKSALKNLPGRKSLPSRPGLQQRWSHLQQGTFQWLVRRPENDVYSAAELSGPCW